MYITVKQAAEKWNISDSSEEKPDAYQEGRAWKIPYEMQRSQLMEDIKLQNPSFQY